jgi:hypothetical protein
MEALIEPEKKSDPEKKGFGVLIKGSGPKT